MDPGQTSDKSKKAQTELQKRTQYIKSLQRNYECISNAFKKLNLQLDATKQELSAVKQGAAKAADNEQERCQLRDTIQNLLADNTSLAGQVALLKDDLAVSSSNLQSCRDRLTQLSAQNQLLEEEIAKISTSAQESRSLISAANQKVRENAALLEKKERIQASMHTQISQLHAKIGEQEQQIRKLEIDIQKANNVSYRIGIDRDNVKFEISRIRRESAGIETEHKSTLRKLQELEDLNKGLKLELKSLKAQTNLDEFKKVLDETVASRQAAYDRCDQLAVTIEELRERQNLLEVKVSELRSSEKTKDRRIAELEEICSEHERNIVDLGSAKEELLACLEELQSVKHERDVLTRENEDLKQTVEEIESQRKVWMDEVRGLFGDSSGQQRMFAELEEINTRLHTSQEQVRAEIAAVQEERDQLRQAAINAVKRSEKLEGQLNHFHEQASQMRKGYEHDSMQLRQELESTVTSLRQQLTDQKKDLDHLRQRNKEFMKQPRLSAAEVKAISEREKELNATVSKLVLAEQSSEPAYTCMDCMKIFTDPVTCIPCGHSACEKCIIRAGICIQCGDRRRVSYYPNQLLAELSAKHVYRKQALAGLLQMSQQHLENQDQQDHV